MAATIFLALSTVWLVGFTALKLRCVRIEGDLDPQGVIGSFIGTGWLRGSNEASRRYRGLALGWAGVGLMLIVLVTTWAQRFDG